MKYDNISQSGQKAINEEAERLLNTKQSPTSCICHCHVDAKQYSHVADIHGKDICPYTSCPHCQPKQEKSEVEPTSNTEELKKAPHWTECNCICHGFHDSTGVTCPHCHPEDHPGYRRDTPYKSKLVNEREVWIKNLEEWCKSYLLSKTAQSYLIDFIQQELTTVIETTRKETAREIVGHLSDKHNYTWITNEGEELLEQILLNLKKKYLTEGEGK